MAKQSPWEGASARAVLAALGGACAVLAAWGARAQVPESAVSWSARAAAADLGIGGPRDPEEARRAYGMGAASGDPESMLDVAVMMDSARGGPRDAAGAAGWYRAASDRGMGRASYALGLMLRDGDGVPRDAVGAAAMFRRAEAQGVRAGRAALVALGSTAVRPATAMAVAGGGTEGLARTATGDARRSASGRAPPPPAGSADGVRSVGVMEGAESIGAVAQLPSRDLVARLSADAAGGELGAEYGLGILRERGIGLPRDRARAYAHYVTAAAGGAGDLRIEAERGAVRVGATLSETERAQAVLLLAGSGPVGP